MVVLIARRTMALWRSILSSPPLTLNGWLAFNLPRTVTAIGQSVLTGLVAVHVYVFTTEPSLPGYFAVYSAVLITGCVIAAGAMLLGRKAAVAQAGWYLGSLVCLGFLATYLVSRWFTRPGLEALTGRWDFASGTLAMAFAGAFIAVHATILSGINVAHPRQRDWRD